MTIGIYKIDDSYIKEIRKLDGRVLENKEQRRPYVGVIIDINQYHYYIPMSSAKFKTVEGKKIINKLNKQVTVHFPEDKGYLKFNNMIPVPLDKVSKVNIKEERDEAYKKLLFEQYGYIRKNEKKLKEKASKVRKIKNCASVFGVVVDFNKLEKYYDLTHSKESEGQKKTIKKEKER